MAQIDHFMYAVPDLADGIAWATQTFDAAPAYGGAHVGLGTCNALLSLGDCYLEIIAPDPAQNQDGNMGGRFAALSEGGLVTWAARGELSETAAKLRELDIQCAGPNRTERKTADGDTLVWELLIPSAPRFGSRMPFFIDWLECPHPCTTNPLGGSYAGLQITSPLADDLQSVLDALSLGLTVQPGEPGLALAIDCDKGPVVLASTPETTGLSLG